MGGRLHPAVSRAVAGTALLGRVLADDHASCAVDVDLLALAGGRGRPGRDELSIIRPLARCATLGPDKEGTMLQLVLVVALVFAVGIAVFAVQNTAPVEVAFLVWRAQGVAASVLVLVAAALGA